MEREVLFRMSIYFVETVTCIDCNLSFLQVIQLIYLYYPNKTYSYGNHFKIE
jgi:hypothetical protein